MPYERELSFLCDVLARGRVGVERVALSTLAERMRTAEAELPFALRGLTAARLSSLAEKTLYLVSDPMGISYRLMLLPGITPVTLLLIGPYRTFLLSEAERMEVGERLGFSPNRQQYFAEYYNSIPHLRSDDPLFLMLNAFCERAFSCQSFAVEELHTDLVGHAPLGNAATSSMEADAAMRAKAMEQRYAFENELIRAVEQGQLHTEERLLSALSGSAFERRLADTLRNSKNYAIIMNTLLRKAAERGGVHPAAIDRVSSAFAAAIEELPTAERAPKLMREMFRTYCLLVREQSTLHLPRAVRETVLRIHADLSSDLSTGSLARAQGVSTAYLSSAFRRAMGVTLSEYVRSRRMQYAARLLLDTGLEIQTVALHCGLPDLQYFSKLFKAEYGMSPSRYRAVSQRNA